MQKKQRTHQAQRLNEEIMMKVRAMVKSLLDDDISPSDISFSLAYTATELGLIVAPNPIQVLPVVLGAVSGAVISQQDELMHEKETIECTLIPGQSMLLH